MTRNVVNVSTPKLVWYHTLKPQGCGHQFLAVFRGFLLMTTPKVIIIEEKAGEGGKGVGSALSADVLERGVVTVVGVVEMTADDHYRLHENRNRAARRRDLYATDPIYRLTKLKALWEVRERKRREGLKFRRVDGKRVWAA